MHLLIIDQCSNQKSFPSGSPVFDIDAVDNHSIDELVAKDDAVALPARRLYDGRQQKYVGEAVDSLRSDGHTVDRYFISAGFGLVEEDEAIPPYEVTFNGMSAGEKQARSESLGISADVEQVVDSSTYDMVFFTLGSDYYQVLDLSKILSSLSSETIGVLFNQEELGEEYENVVSVPARNSEAKEQGTIVVALKGVYLKNFAAQFSDASEASCPDSPEAVYDACMKKSTEQKDLSEF